jgi:RNA polymerase I-specific transcription initiation factor RRN7
MYGSEPSLTQWQITEIPFKMRDRLPPQYQKMLRGGYNSLAGGELHAVVTDLVMGYQKNYDMVFPPLNTPLLLLRYLRELALPCESFRWKALRGLFADSGV